MADSRDPKDLNIARPNLTGARILGLLIGFAIPAACCLGACLMAEAEPLVPFVGNWKSVNTKVVKVVKNGQEREESVSEAFLSLSDFTEYDGDGFYTDENSLGHHFHWQHNRNKKKLVMTMDEREGCFWHGIKSPATFQYEISGDQMTLRAGDDSLVFTKVTPVDVNAKDRKQNP